jgi:2-dehydro-3-deoxyglucarate aldolase/4-hydroxy-2-oxoheptanedioate aldolase
MFDPKKPTLKARLKRGEPLSVCWLALGSVTLIEAAVAAGAEGVIIDMQHGLFDRLSLEAAIAAVPPHVPCLVRVEDDRPTALARALDAGAEGVIVPLVESAEQAARAACACHFPPNGVRSGGGIRPLRQHGYMDAAADAITVGVMIETRIGVKNAAEIAAADNVDFVFIGTGDLALSLDVAAGSAEHSRACAKILKACRKAGRPCGIFTMTPDIAAARIAEGYWMAVVANDVSTVSDAFAGATAAFRNARGDGG